ncbi:MAG: ubiquinol oxidase subunit II [Acetobacteraceae bacterium]|nr:ubiquinol oxidase subunit II [Acetobacteraceae bacterium]
MLAVTFALAVSGCSFDVLDPKGSVGLRERHLIFTATWVMLLVVVPVIILTLVFAWRYRATNKAANYQPTWSHSTAIEVAVWSIPTLIILFLANLTWTTTHELDPYRPLPVAATPIDVDVVALDWKWLFIYPSLGVASVNELAMPVGTPVSFHITSDTVMNSFFIPQLGSQIYAMAGMETQLHLIADTAGDYAGMSANFSGPGFSDMTFRALALPQPAFDQWVSKLRAAPAQLDEAAYRSLAKPGTADRVTYFSQVNQGLFHSIMTEHGGSMQMSSGQTGSAKMASTPMGSMQMGSMQMGPAQMGPTPMGPTMSSTEH